MIEKASKHKRAVSYKHDSELCLFVGPGVGAHTEDADLDLQPHLHICTTSVVDPAIDGERLS